MIGCVYVVGAGLTARSDIFVATVKSKLLFIDMQAQARPFWHMKIEVPVLGAGRDDVVFQQERSEQLCTPGKLWKSGESMCRCDRPNAALKHRAAIQGHAGCICNGGCTQHSVDSTGLRDLQCKHV